MPINSRFCMFCTEPTDLHQIGGKVICDDCWGELLREIFKNGYVSTPITRIINPLKNLEDDGK